MTTHYRQDRRLSYRAKGILEYLLTLPPGSTMAARDVAPYGTESLPLVRKAMYELQEYGYLLVEIRRRQDGRQDLPLPKLYAVSETARPEWAVGPA